MARRIPVRPSIPFPFPTCSGSGTVGTSSTLTQGGRWRLSGSGFGTNVPASNQIYRYAEIEALANGTALSTSHLGSNWTKPGEATQSISTARAYNGTRSIRNAYSASNYQFGIQKNLTETFKRFYGNTICYLSTGAQSTGQLKLDRFGDAVSGSAGLGDGSWNGSTSSDERPNCFLQYFPNTFPTNLCRFYGPNDPNTSGLNTGGSGGLIARDNWTRVERDLIPGSAGSANGSISVRSENLTDNSVLVNATASSVQFRMAADAEFQRWTLQFYIGNGFQVSGALVDIDQLFYGIYNAVDTAFPKFVYFGNASTFAACTIFVIEVFDSWADTVIEGDVNKGALAGLAPGVDLWGYVMQGIGNPINSSGIVPTSLS